MLGSQVSQVKKPVGPPRPSPSSSPGPKRASARAARPAGGTRLQAAARGAGCSRPTRPSRSSACAARRSGRGSPTARASSPSAALRQRLALRLRGHERRAAGWALQIRGRPGSAAAGRSVRRRRHHARRGRGQRRRDGTVLGPADPAAQPEPAGEPDETAPAAELSAEERAALEAAEAEERRGRKREPEPPPPPPSEEEVAVRGMQRVLGGLWSGVPRIPARWRSASRRPRRAGRPARRREHPDGTVSIIPFLPNLVSGPPSRARRPRSRRPTRSCSSPARSTGRKSTTRRSARPRSTRRAAGGGRLRGDRRGGEGRAQPTATRPSRPSKNSSASSSGGLAARARQRGRRHLRSTRATSARAPRAGGDEKKEEREAEPGFLYIAALNNPSACARFCRARSSSRLRLARHPAARRERKGFDIHVPAGLRIPTPSSTLPRRRRAEAVRHCVDSFEARQTLASANAYRDAVACRPSRRMSTSTSPTPSSRTPTRR